MIDQAEIHRKANSSRLEDRIEAVSFLGSAFSQFSDKVQAWQDLYKLTEDEDAYVRRDAAHYLGTAFLHIPDKFQAWQALNVMTYDEDSYVRKEVASSLGCAFLHVSDQFLAWQDLIRLAHDGYSYVRKEAASSLISAILQIPDKFESWQYLHNLTQDKDSGVRWRAAFSLGSEFFQFPDKAQAWKDLIRLIKDEDVGVRWVAAYFLGSALLHVADKAQAWQDLNKLTYDEDSYVRMYAYHSLGKLSVHMATEAEDINILRKNLEAAIEYFKKSAQESEDSPARFCSFFYRSYFSVTFQGESQEVIQKYLEEAKEAVGWSESRDELLKAVENLAGALQETQKLKDRPLPEVLRDLKAYEWYCTQAEAHMASVEDRFPGAVKLLRKGNPWIKQNIDATIREIQDYAWQICQATHDKGPGAKAFCRQIKEVAGSFTGEDLTETLHTVSDFVSLLKEKCQILPEGDRELVWTQLDGIDSKGAIPEKLNKIKIVVKFFLSRIHEDGEFLRRLEEIKGKMDAMHADLTSFRELIFSRFDSSERAILSAIFERLDKDNLEIVDTILDAIKNGSIPQELTVETLDATKDLIAEIRAIRLDILDPNAAKSLDAWEEAINSPELNIENMIKVTIPIIPFLLTYEGSYKFQTGMKLDSTWDKLRALVRR